MRVDREVLLSALNALTVASFFGHAAQGLIF
jgi:hypothetical protein